MMKIPWAMPHFWGKEERFVVDALRSTWISDGPYVGTFEKEFAERLGVKFCITTSSGTAALQLALLAAGVGPGDEVIVPGFAFIAPANMILAVGARPVYADIDADTWCMDIGSVKRCVSPKTRAIVAVHSYGNVCDMGPLLRFARARGIFLIEDVAEAAFSKYQGRLTGTFGDVGCFSFQATKTIVMGEGGCVVTENKRLSEQMRMIRDHGRSHRRKYWHDVVGNNFRLTNLQAALGYAQLKALGRIIVAKQRVVDRYQRFLSGEEGIKLQIFKHEVSPVVWCVAVELDPRVFLMGRDAVMKRLAEAGIETRPGFYPPSVMPIYQARPLPVAEHVAANVIVLPSFVTLTEMKIRYICNRLKRLRKGAV